jgi:hypothetical protein
MPFTLLLCLFHANYLPLKDFLQIGDQAIRP